MKIYSYLLFFYDKNLIYSVIMPILYNGVFYKWFRYLSYKF